MARRKEITRDQILVAALIVVEEQGFHRFTARSVARQMKCSTQPIYLEFTNMDGLREAVFNRIHDYLGDEIFSKSVTGDNVVDMGLNYIAFARERSQLFKALFIEDYDGGERMYNFSEEMFTKHAKEDEHYQNLSAEIMDRLHSGTWITVTGLASLMSSGILTPDQKQLTAIIQDAIATIVAHEPNEAIGKLR